MERRVYISFIIERDESKSSVNVIRGIRPECDDEMKRARQSK